MKQDVSVTGLSHSHVVYSLRTSVTVQGAASKLSDTRQAHVYKSIIKFEF